MTDITPAAGRIGIVAVIFDLDGVLVDSEPVYLGADQHLFAELGLTLTEADKRSFIGRGSREMMERVVARYGLREAVSALVARKDALYLDRVLGAVPVNAPARDLLHAVRAAGMPVALASGSSAGVLEAILVAAGLRDHFDAILSADEVVHGKPAPDLFLLAAQRLGVAPEACVVIEDSVPGVTAALAAGMRCIAIPYQPDLPLDPVYRQADLLVEEGMDAADAAEMAAWIAARRISPR